MAERFSLSRFGIVVMMGLAWVPAIRGEEARPRVAAAVRAVDAKVIAWRRDLHEHPELSNREFRTAERVAEHLRALGLDEIKTGVAHTGVVGTLRGALPGPVVALRADMDALPVKERVDLPFASKARAEYNGEQVDVMHACGHDAHTAILMGAAEVLAGMRAELRGTVKFIFQPAEEGAPQGEEGGAALMLAQGLFDGPDKPEAIFGLHVWPGAAGTLRYRPEGTMAASDRLHIVVEGRQTHGSSPWRGVDPVIVAAQIMTALQTIPSRQLDVTAAPAVVSIGAIHGGVRFNIIPDKVEMQGTIRTFDMAMREDLLVRIRRTVEHVAASAGAKATVTIESNAPVTFNDPELTRKMVPTLEWAAGEGKVRVGNRIMAAEDFAYFQQKVPGLYFFLGINKEGVAENEAASNHSPEFFVNEDALIVGVRAMVGVALDYAAHPAP